MSGARVDLRKRRQHLGLSGTAMYLRVAGLLPPAFMISQRQLDRIEKGDSPLGNAAPEVRAAVAEAYKVPLSELDPEGYPDVVAIGELLVRSKWDELQHEATA